MEDHQSIKDLGASARVTTVEYIKKYSYAIYNLFKLNLLAQHRRSQMNFFWFLFNPFSGIIIWLIVHWTGFFNPTTQEVPYVWFLLTNFTIWTLFFQIYTFVSSGLKSNPNLIMEGNIPVMINLVERFMSAFSLYIIPVIITCFLSIQIAGVWSLQLFWIPFFLLFIIAIAFAWGLISSLLKYIVQDLDMVLDKLMGFGMFLCPVVYSENVGSGTFGWIIRHNPLSILMIQIRKIIFFGTTPAWDMNTWIVIVCTILLVTFAISFFYKCVHLAIERIWM